MDIDIRNVFKNWKKSKILFRKQPITYSSVHACGFIFDSDEDFPRKSFKPKKYFAENSVYSLYNDTSKHSLAEDCVYSLYNDTSTEHFKKLKPKLH